jgi:hypothetical protein
MQNFWQHYRTEMVWFIALFLISTLSFAFGFMIGKEMYRTPIVIEKVGGQ